MAKRKRKNTQKLTINILHLAKKAPVILLLAAILYLVAIIQADKPYQLSFEHTQAPQIVACFTPQHDCEKLIVNQINNAKQQILIQAYSFTSKPITKALIAAHNKNIEVKLLLDKSQNVHNNIALQSLQQANIPIIYDQQLPAIAHNKVMIFDQKIVLTGSYNFTYSAQHRNAENLLLIYEPLIAQQYLDNWLNRLYAQVHQSPKQPTSSNKH
jgi:phospholipase D